MSFAQAAGAAGQLIQGIGGFVSGLHNQKVLKGQAIEELAAAQERERLQQADARKAIGAQLAAQWGNGLEGGSGTALDAIRESEIQAMLDAREIRRQGISKAASLREQGRGEVVKGAFALASGLLGAGSTVSSMQHDWAQARTGSSK